VGFRHLVLKNSRIRFSDLFVLVRDGGTRWPLVVEDSTGWYEMDGGSFPAGTRWLAEVSRLVRDGWQKFPAGTRWLAEVSGWYEMAG
jgi:hypothetical protein